MKKILAIGLALAMMTTTAFAATIKRKNIEPGTEIKFSMYGFKDRTWVFVTGAYDADKNGKPIKASEYKIHKLFSRDSIEYYNHSDDLPRLGAHWDHNKYYSTKLKEGFMLDTTPSDDNPQWAIDGAKLAIDKLARQDIQPYDFTAQNFRVTLDAPIGRNLIKSTTFDGEGNLVVTIKDGYRLPSIGAPDLKVNKLSVISTRDIRHVNGTEIALHSGREFTADLLRAGGGKLYSDGKTLITVGVVAEETPIVSGQEEMLDGDGAWTKFTADAGVHRGTVKFDDPATGLVVTGTVYSGDVVSFKYDPTPSNVAMRVMQNNPDAVVEVHNITARGFNSAFTVSIPVNSVCGASADANGVVEVLSSVAENNKYVYLLSSTGVLTPLPFTYNSATGTLQGRLPAKGGTILISDTALHGVTVGGGNTGTVNPSTGFGVGFGGAIVK